MRGRGLQQHTAGLAMGLALLSLPCGVSRLEAAGSAYVVDTAEVGEVGNCKLESWVSWADNRDFIASMTPACVVDFGHPVDVSAQVSRARADGEWTTTVSPQLKANVLPTAIGRIGFAVSATATVDTISREATAFMVTVPATLRLSERMRLNLNVGWMLDRALDAHFFTYGAGLDWIVHGPWIVTTEVFGPDRARRFRQHRQAALAGGAAFPSGGCLFRRHDLRPQYHRRKRQLADACGNRPVLARCALALGPWVDQGTFVPSPR
jgi:hypothetical protein